MGLKFCHNNKKICSLYSYKIAHKLEISHSICNKMEQQAANVCSNKLRQPVVVMNVGGGHTGISC